MMDAVPEFSDGGYWYVVSTKIDAETGGVAPSIPAGVPYAAWAWSAGECVIKTKTALAVPQGSVTVAQLIDHPRKPKAVF